MYIFLPACRRILSLASSHGSIAFSYLSVGWDLTSSLSRRSTESQGTGYESRILATLSPPVRVFVSQSMERIMGV